MVRTTRRERFMVQSCSGDRGGGTASSTVRAQASESRKLSRHRALAADGEMRDEGMRERTEAAAPVVKADSHTARFYISIQSARYWLASIERTVPMPAVAFSNNDIAVVAWTFDRHLDGCLGFAVHQIDVTAGNKEMVLPALARFENQDKALKLTTEQAPIQKFWWKDLFARRGSTYRYRIVPMGGTPGEKLTPLKDVPVLLSNQVTLTPSRPPFYAYFN